MKTSAAATHRSGLNLVALLITAALASACTAGNQFRQAENHVLANGQRSVVSRSDVPTHVLGAGSAEIQVLLDQSKGLSSAALSHFVAASGWSVPEHSHQEADEILFILEGGGELTLRGEKMQTRAGDAIFIPRNSLHSFVAGPQGLKALQVYAPGGPEQRFLKAPTKPSLPAATTTPEFTESTAPSIP